MFGEYRLKKRRKSSSTLTNGEIKRRNSTICEKDQCLVTETDVSITGLSSAVALKHDDEHLHLHPLGPGFMIKDSKQVQELINKETEELSSCRNLPCNSWCSDGSRCFASWYCGWTITGMQEQPPLHTTSSLYINLTVIHVTIRYVPLLRGANFNNDIR